MTKQTQVNVASVAQATAQPVQAPAAQAVEAPKVTMSIDDVENFASETVTAFTTFDRTVAKANATQMESIKDACAYLPANLTAADYDRLVLKGLKAALALAVKRGKLEQSTATKKQSQLKTVALAICNGVKPDEGMGFVPFYDHAVQALAGPSYTYVYGDKPKAGAPAGTVSHKKGKGRISKTQPAGNASPVVAAQVSAQAGGASRSPEMAAALILTKGHESRASKLVTVMQSFMPEFDKWAATILEDNKSSPMPEGLKLASVK